MFAMIAQVRDFDCALQDTISKERHRLVSRRDFHREGRNVLTNARNAHAHFRCGTPQRECGMLWENTNR
jgi:hypothetical protein